METTLRLWHLLGSISLALFAFVVQLWRRAKYEAAIEARILALEKADMQISTDLKEIKTLLTGIDKRIESEFSKINTEITHLKS